MKKCIIYLFLTALFAVECMAQVEVKQTFSAMPITDLPFVAAKGSHLIAPRKTYYFPHMLWSELNRTLYTDFGSTVGYPNTNDDYSITRRFEPTNGNYYVGTITMYDGDYSKSLLVTANQDGEIIDQIIVESSGTSYSGNTIYSTQYKINSGMIIYVYKLSTNSRVNYTDNAGHISGEIILQQYTIDSSGYFQNFGESQIKRGLFSISELSNKKRNLWEMYAGTGETAKAVLTAQKILAQPLKVENTFTLRAKARMRQYLNELSETSISTTHNINVNKLF